MSPAVLRTLSVICAIAAFASIAASIAIWFLFKTEDPAHGERFGIFVGLWAPTFLALATYLSLAPNLARRSPVPLGASST